MQIHKGLADVLPIYDDAYTPIVTFQKHVSLARFLPLCFPQVYDLNRVNLPSYHEYHFYL